jgi:ABC-type phosphate transport system substrate-binding protein
MMFKKTIATAVAGGALLLTTVMGTGISSAATTTQVFPNYGFDGNAHLIVGGGSTTIYKLTQSLATLWDDTSSCLTNNANFNGAGGPTGSQFTPTYPTANPVFNQCSPTSQSYAGTNAGGNYDGDTVTVAAPTGSSDGIASLNADHGSTAGVQAYEGTNSSLTGDNGYGTVDFALSSRGPKLTGGNCALTGPTGNTDDEEACDTFWGIAADGVEVFTWQGTNFNQSEGLSAQDLFGIFNCQYTTWGALPDYASDVAGGATLPPSTAPIVPWGMNSGSGTFADFDSYVAANATGVPAGWTVDNSCEKTLAGSVDPLENDTKPLLQDVQANDGGISTDPTSKQDPANWIWFGSYALLHNYSFLSAPLQFGTTYNTNPVGINGITPSTTNIHSGGYPIPRVVSLVTANADASCPVNTAGTGCDFSAGTQPVNGNGTTDLSVTGANTGKGGAVREFIRFVCRTKAESAIPGSTQLSPADPYTGVAGVTEVASALASNGFSALPTKDVTTGSSCDVQAHQ